MAKYNNNPPYTTMADLNRRKKLSDYNGTVNSTAAAAPKKGSVFGRPYVWGPTVGATTLIAAGLAKRLWDKHKAKTANLTDANTDDVMDAEPGTWGDMIYNAPSTLYGLGKEGAGVIGQGLMKGAGLGKDIIGGTYNVGKSLGSAAWKGASPYVSQAGDMIKAVTPEPVRNAAGAVYGPMKTAVGGAYNMGKGALGTGYGIAKDYSLPWWRRAKDYISSFFSGQDPNTGVGTDLQGVPLQNELKEQANQASTNAYGGYVPRYAQGGNQQKRGFFSNNGPGFGVGAGVGVGGMMAYDWYKANELAKQRAELYKHPKYTQHFPSLMKMEAADPEGYADSLEEMEITQPGFVDAYNKFKAGDEAYTKPLEEERARRKLAEQQYEKEQQALMDERKRKLAEIGQQTLQGSAPDVSGSTLSASVTPDPLAGANAYGGQIPRYWGGGQLLGAAGSLLSGGLSKAMPYVSSALPFLGRNAGNILGTGWGLYNAYKGWNRGNAQAGAAPAGPVKTFADQASGPDISQRRNNNVNMGVNSFPGRFANNNTSSTTPAGAIKTDTQGNIANVSGSRVGNFLGGLGALAGGVGGAAQGLGNFASQYGPGIMGAARQMNILPDPNKGWGEQIGSNLGNAVYGLTPLGAIGAAFGTNRGAQLMNMGGAWLGRQADNYLPQAFEKATGFVSPYLAKAGLAAKDYASKLGANLGEAIPKATSSVINAGTGALKNVGNALYNAAGTVVNNAGNVITGLGNKAADWVNNNANEFTNTLYNSTGAYNGNPLPGPMPGGFNMQSNAYGGQVPRYAKGGSKKRSMEINTPQYGNPMEGIGNAGSGDYLPYGAIGKTAAGIGGGILLKELIQGGIRKYQGLPFFPPMTDPRHAMLDMFHGSAPEDKYLMAHKYRKEDPKFDEHYANWAAKNKPGESTYIPKENAWESHPMAKMIPQIHKMNPQQRDETINNISSLYPNFRKHYNLYELDHGEGFQGNPETVDPFGGIPEAPTMQQQAYGGYVPRYEQGGRRSRMDRFDDTMDEHLGSGRLPAYLGTGALFGVLADRGSQWAWRKLFGPKAPEEMVDPQQAQGPYVQAAQGARIPRYLQGGTSGPKMNAALLTGGLGSIIGGALANVKSRKDAEDELQAWLAQHGNDPSNTLPNELLHPSHFKATLGGGILGGLVGSTGGAIFG